mmetsp:Transcript_20256/g.23279  ORF Transcript_20256/g.23279 Transcript_20256/m.23279 type:complete len:232 (+) Transcript_20256:71-766(+)|eukprot:CAMPEP_0194398206 /NCGR_PEP_ID=MMETSP0174-20130528/125975_1 /TAXON_ID=216777 /ORGANISM="Proboscia alata, Strain PI-D3" /LENGTH=231 /DNA_ID=CAMNT_0039194477 /DNA_START=35 /DNA_END=730 /DNA_ORIENTATION=-
MAGSQGRKAWNDAMGLSKTSSRRSHRQSSAKQARREKARKRDDHGAESSFESREYRAAVRIDSLEEVFDNSATGVNDDGAGDEEYDEEEDFRGASKKNKSSKSKRKRCGSASSVTARSVKIKGGKKIDGTIPKRLKRRTLASILVEDSSRPDGMTKQYLDAEALSVQSSKYPPRKMCPVTGLLGIYTDPKSGIPYANLKALEQIRERKPPWLSVGGSAAYYEALKSLRNED